MAALDGGACVFVRVVGATGVEDVAFVVVDFADFFAGDIAGGWVSAFGCDVVGFAVLAGSPNCGVSGWLFGVGV